MQSDTTDKATSVTVRRNTIYYFLQFMVLSGTTLVASPLLLRYLGTQDFGLWKICQRLMDFAAFADGRSSQALKSSLANAVGRRLEDDGKRQLIGAALKTWVFFLPALIAVCVLLVVLAPALTNTSAYPERHRVVYWMTGILALNIIASPLLGIPDATLMALGRSYRSSQIQILGATLTLALMYAATFSAVGIYLIPLAVTCVAVITGIIANLFTKLTTPWYGIEYPSRHTFGEFFKFSGGTLFGAAVERATLSVDIILIGKYCGLADVSKYTFSSYIYQLAIAICLIGTSAVTPLLSQRLGEGSFSEAKHYVHFVRTRVLFFATFFCICILLFNKVFVSIWAGNGIYAGKDVDILLALALFQIAYCRSEGQLLDSAMKNKAKIALATTSLLITIAASIWLNSVSELTIETILLAIIAGRLAMTIGLPIVVNKFYQTTSTQAKSALTAVAVITTATIGSSIESLGTVPVIHVALGAVLILITVMTLGRTSSLVSRD